METIHFQAFMFKIFIRYSLNLASVIFLLLLLLFKSMASIWKYKEINEILYDLKPMNWVLISYIIQYPFSEDSII